MTENDRVARYRAWKDLLEEFPADFKIAHIVTRDSFTPTLETKNALGFWLTLEKLEPWELHPCINY